MLEATIATFRSTTTGQKQAWNFTRDNDCSKSGMQNQIQEIFQYTVVVDKMAKILSILFMQCQLHCNVVTMTCCFVMVLWLIMDTIHFKYAMLWMNLYYSSLIQYNPGKYNTIYLEQELCNFHFEFLFVDFLEQCKAGYMSYEVLVVVHCPELVDTIDFEYAMLWMNMNYNILSNKVTREL